MLKMFRVSRIQHVSTNDWQDGYGDYQNRQPVHYGVTSGKNLKEAKKKLVSVLVMPWRQETL